MSELVLIFANNLLPILLISAAGYLIGNFLHIDPKPFGRIIFNILAPVFIFDLLTRNHLSSNDVLLTVGYTLSIVLVFGLLVLLIGRLLRLEKPVLMAVLLTLIFTNSGNYGLPLISFVFGEEALAFASIYFITNAILVNTAGVVIASMGKSTIKKSLTGLVKVPTIYAVLLAIILTYTGWSLPEPLEKTVNLISSAAIPSMIILLGIQLSEAKWNSNIKALSLGVILKMGIGPIIGFILAGLFGLQGQAWKAGIINSALPTAVMTTILASEYDLEPSLVTSIVFVTTIISPLTLTPIIFLLS